VDVMKGCPLPIEVGSVGRGCAHSPLSGENVLIFQVKMQDLCVLLQKNYLWSETGTGET